MTLFLLIILVISSLWTILNARLMRAVVGLALTSLILSMVIYRMHSPLAAVFELSVCAGLISVIFITTVSFTQRLTPETLPMRRSALWKRFWFLPLLVVGLVLWAGSKPFGWDFTLHQEVLGRDAKEVLWQMRPLDIFGQVIVLLAGALGVAVFFKSRSKDKS